MRKTVLTAAALGLATASLIGPAQAKDPNPMFGSAIAKPTTVDENKAVVAKGSYSDYYGGYGYQYAYYAYIYGYYGKSYDSKSYYSYASNYAYYAYYYLYYASAYASNS